MQEGRVCTWTAFLPGALQPFPRDSGPALWIPSWPSPVNSHICLLLAGIDLENIVYYKDDTHYFVMTAKKQSLLDKGVILHVSNGFLSGNSFC